MTGEGQRVTTSRESAFRCTAHWGASPPGVICAGWGRAVGASPESTPQSDSREARVADWTARGYAVAITVGRASRVTSGEKAASCTSSRRAAN